MKSSNIGGQAVLEGIMMKNKDRYAVAVRKPDQEIEVDVQEYKSIVPWKAVSKIPFIRGIFSFVDSLVLGMKTLMYSASFFEDEEVDAKELTEEEAEKEEKKERILMNLTVAFSVVLAIGIFMVLPYFLSNLVRSYVASHWVLTIVEGVIRVGIFLAYIALNALIFFIAVILGLVFPFSHRLIVPTDTWSSFAKSSWDKSAFLRMVRSSSCNAIALSFSFQKTTDIIT